MSRAFFITTSTIVAMTLSMPSYAGIQKDLSSCTAGRDLKSASACTRILKSGRLRKKERYIAYYNRGWAYRNSGDYTSALRDFNIAIKLNRNFAQSYYSRSVVRYDRGETDEAVSDLERYVKLKGKTWIAYYNRALMLRRLDKPHKALSDLQVAEKLKPKKKKIALLRALVLSDLDDHKAALAEINPILAKSPDNARAYHARAVVLSRQNRYTEALTDVEEALKIRKPYAAAYLLKGRILEDTGKIETARAHYKKALAAPAKSVEELYGQKSARKRLAAIDGEDIKTAKASDSEQGSSSHSKLDVSPKCRRFIPAANTTIEIDC